MSVIPPLERERQEDPRAYRPASLAKSASTKSASESSYLRDINETKTNNKNMNTY